MDINKKISIYFLEDSRDYLIRYQVLKERAAHLGLRSKLLLELLFALECSLKSIIFFESSEDEKATYNKVRTHKLDKLSMFLSENSKQKFDNLLKKYLTDFSVDIRYKLESEIDFRTKEGVLAEKYYNTIANVIWLDELYLQISNFIEYISGLNPFEIITINFNDINISDKIKEYQQLSEIRTKTR